MKLFKKVFLFSLVFVVALGLLGCNGNSEQPDLSENEAVLELQAKLDELRESLAGNEAALEAAGDLLAKLEADIALLNSQLNSSNTTVQDLENRLEEAQAELDKLNQKSPEELILDYLVKERKFNAASYEWTNEAELLAELDFDEESEVYSVEAGTTLELVFAGTEATAEYSIGGVTLEFEKTFPGAEYVGFDYFWTNTFDYNNGVEFDKATGELKFNFVGTYVVGFYSLDLLPDLEYSVQSIHSWLNNDAVPESAEGKFSYLVFEVEAGPEVLTAEDDNELEIVVGRKNQLKVTQLDKYTVVKYESANEEMITVSSTGEVEALAEGRTHITVTLKDKTTEVERTVVLPVTVFELPEGLLAGGSEGQFINLRYSSVDQKAKILAHMERYLINSGASIPVINNSGLVIYSERVNFIADEYIAQMGFGPTAVPLETGRATGTESDPAYRMWTSANPGTLNHLQYADSIESDFLTLLNGNLFTFNWRVDEDGRGVGWEVKPEMADKLAYPVELVDGEYVEVEDWNGLTENKLWKFDLRDDLRWENGEAINADDFIYTFKEALDGNIAYRRANLWHSGSYPIAGAKDYYDAKGDLDWDTVGIKQVDEHSFVIEYVNNVIQWDVIYNGSGFMFTPIHKATYELNKATYGTNAERFMASGPYKISYWESGKEFRFTKNDEYFLWDENAEVEVRRPVLENYSYTIVRDNNAALQLFKDGDLDVTSVPASAYDEYSNWPNQKFTPGATAFRLSVNKLTQAEIDTRYGKNAWEAKPILQEEDFNWALYFGLDRLGVQAITKTSTAWSSYFTNAYSLVSTTEAGTEVETYRNTDWGKQVYQGIFEDDIPLLEDSLGYNPALATLFYEAAVQSMIDKGVIVEGTEANPTKITIEVAHFDGVTQEAVYAYVVQKYNELFNNTAKFGRRVVFEAKSAPQPGMDVYYVKQMTGQFDLGLAGISGGTLNPVGFLETFLDDNRSGLFLSLGFDSHSPQILIDLDLDGDGELDGEMWWSFAALYRAFNGESFIKDGMEAEAPKEE